MTVVDTTLEILVEEPSANQALSVLLPRIVPGQHVNIREFHGKDELLRILPALLRSYVARMRYERLKVIVLLDRDQQDCVALKSRLDDEARNAGLRVTTDPGTTQVLNRIVIEELEAWYFGDVPALCRVYPRLSPHLAEQARYRDPDAIAGGTWEALERLLRAHGYRQFNKFEAASRIAAEMDVEVNRSRSFQVFRDGIRRLVNEDSHA